MADEKFSQFTAGGNCQVGDIVVGLRASDNTKFTFPGTGIEDSSGNFLLGYTSIGSTAVNYISISNAATTANPAITVAGSDVNVDLQISSKGTGSIFFNGITVDYLNNLSAITTATFPGSTSGNAILKAQASAGTPTLELPTSSGILALTSDLPILPLSLSNGGTGASLTASNGGIFYSNATTGVILSGTAAAGQILRSGASSAPSWSTATYPSTTSANQLLYSSSANVVAGLAGSNSGVLVSTSASIPVWSNAMMDGQVIIGSSGAQPQAAALTAGTGVSITNAANSITIASTTTGGGVTWATIAGTTQTATVNSGWIPTNSGLTTITLPATASIGSVVSVQGQGSGGWTVDAPGSQIIHVGSTATSAGGTVSSANRYDAITLVCIVADTEWGMYGPVSSGFITT